MQTKMVDVMNSTFAAHLAGLKGQLNEITKVHEVTNHPVSGV